MIGGKRDDTLMLNRCLSRYSWRFIFTFLLLSVLAPASWASDGSDCDLQTVAEKLREALPYCQSAAEHGEVSAQYILGVSGCSMRSASACRKTTRRR